MAVTQTNVHLGGLARKLVLDGLIEQEAHQAALKKKMPLVSYLVENDIVSGDKIARAASQEFGIPLIDIENVEIDPDVTKLVKKELIQKHHALPLFKRGKRLYLAVSDPTNLLALDEIKFAVSMNTEAILVEENKLAKAIDKALEAADGGLDDMDDDDFDDLDGAWKLLKMAQLQKKIPTLMMPLS
jgi:type IV pilus assembly protein PilB